VAAAEAAASRLVFVNGVFASDLSARTLPVGVKLCTFAEALADPALAERVAKELGAQSTQNQNVFTA